MPYADTGSARLYYELTGPNQGEPLLLIHGLGEQLIGWYPGFCQALLEQGFRLILIDNRDTGLSSKHPGVEYTLVDMANDIAGLLDVLKIQSVHVVGQSMGGMIGQILAITHPKLVQSLCLIYSAPDPAYLLEDDEEVRALLDQEPAHDRESAIRQWISSEQISGLEGFEEDWIEEFAAAIYDRSYCPDGFERQARALRSCPDLSLQLPHLRMPTAVIHGRDDRLISFRGGIASAVAIPNSELHIYAEMGHQIIPELWEDFVRVIGRNARRAPLSSDFQPGSGPSDEPNAQAAGTPAESTIRRGGSDGHR
ncbi:hydrolase [Arthrobacter crystallopoietes BAB-32]|uniref:Hydrolase n=1 Tax=Arthrobacter crystallopoietes BAB-32 TaxID=1246476 RepID=N1V0P2_9MICC|nr:alpha/beta hydrolase [Arthrobacter crystallopoietes]EMY34875.1 hydrolase [Arthrobacter crystallopoietes BAB-32]